MEPLFDPITGQSWTDPELDGCPMCALKLIDLGAAEAELRKQRRVNAALRAELARVMEETGETRIARALFRYWVVRSGKDEARTKFGMKRQKAVIARLREGYSPTYIARAIDGGAQFAFVNDRGEKYDDLELICRDEPHLERFHRMAEEHDAATLIGPAWKGEFGED